MKFFVNKSILIISLVLIITCCLGIISQAQAKEDAPYYDIYIVKAVTDSKILPDTPQINGKKDNNLFIKACRGQYEPASFVVQAGPQIKNLKCEVTRLVNNSGNKQQYVDAGVVDVHVVKCWYHSGIPDNETNKCILVPELLLKDDKLVLVDLKQKKNYLRSTDPAGKEEYICISDRDSSKLKDIRPQDAKTLQPVDLEAGSNKQFWLTVHVPADAAPGDYQGKILLSAADAPASSLNLTLRVLPFDLEKPALSFGIYYLGKLTKDTQDCLDKSRKRKMPVINFSFKTPQQYTAEMQDLKEHGIEYPTVYQNDDELLLRQELAIRSQLGFPKDALYSCGVNTWDTSTPQAIEAIKKKVGWLLKISRDLGYENTFIYGRDEAGGAKLAAERPCWQEVHSLGAKIFAAVSNQGSFPLVGDLLDLALIGNRPDPRQAKQYHDVGHRVFCYAFPSSGLVNPVVYRSHYGLLLWQTGYDGAMNYAYQVNYGGHIWNDFDVPKIRNQVYAYPTIDGVVDTIEWEGQRAGIDDVRYLMTLIKYAKDAKPTKPRLAAEAQAWLDKLDINDDLDSIRDQITDWIMKLKTIITTK
jgi:hypothetical protein